MGCFTPNAVSQWVPNSNSIGGDRLHTALADLVDNSMTAGAKNIQIFVE